MASNFNLRAIISAVDRLSPVLRAQQRNIRAWQRQFAAAGKGAMPMAASLAAAIVLPARAFADAENSAISLKNALMTKDGLSAGFAELNVIATQLGNKLPGTTADFTNMATVMRTNGLATQTMINGGLKAAAYLAVSTQGMHETYETAALGIAKMSNVFNVADNDFNELADTMQRVVNLGVGIEPFTSAMSKAGGALKALKVQGLGAVKSVAPVVALLVRAGIDPSEAGTGFKKVLSVFGGAGKFKSIETTINSLQKLYKANPTKLLGVFNKIFGEEHGVKAINIAMPGVYQNTMAEMEKQASLAMRVEESLKSLTNLVDAAQGTFTNVMSVFGAVYAPEMKSTADALNDLADKTGKWIIENGPIVKNTLKAAAAFVALKVAFYAASVAGGILATIAGGPIMALVKAIAIASPFIYENWGKITDFLKDTFGSSIDWIMNKWESLKGIFSSIGNLFGGSGGMSLPGAQSPAQVQREHDARKRMAQSSTATVRGGIDVNFANSPQGMRVAPQQRGPVSVTPNVGYRSLGASGAW
jgi:TP901 family phage tail tape measure protein